MNKSELDYLEFIVTGACIEVHKTLGPGLIKSVYKQCLTHELTLRGINFETNKIIFVGYKQINIATELVTDFIIDHTILMEVKSVDEILPIHKAQLLAGMKLLKVPKGILVNFNCSNIVKEGKIPFVNDYYREISENSPFK